MFGRVVGDAARCALGLLDGIGVFARLGEGDLAEGLDLVCVILGYGDAGRSGHRRVRVSAADGEGEFIIIRPLAAVQDLLDLDLALALRGVVVCELCRLYGSRGTGSYLYLDTVVANELGAVGRRGLSHGVCAGHEAVNGHLVGRAVGYSDLDLAYGRSVRLRRRVAIRIGDVEGVCAVRKRRRRGLAVHRHVLLDLQAAGVDVVLELGGRYIRSVVRFDCYLNIISSDQRHSIRILGRIFAYRILARHKVVDLNRSACAVRDLDRLARYDIASGVFYIEVIRSVCLGRCRRLSVHRHVLRDLQAAVGGPRVLEYDRLGRLCERTAMGAARYRDRSHISILVKFFVGNGGSESISFGLLHLILGAFLEAPEHFLFSVFQLEFNDAVYELVVSVFLVVPCIDGAVVIQDRHSERIVLVLIRRNVTLDLLFNNQTFERPVFDLHGIRVIVDVMAIIHLFHVRCQSDQIIKTDLSVPIELFDLLNMVNLIEIEGILSSVKQDFTIFIGDKH